MKTVGTITEILDLFYKRIDNISIHTKYTAENGKYGYELKMVFFIVEVNKLVFVINSYRLL